MKALFFWVWEEYDLEGKNPMTRVKVSPAKLKPLPGIDLGDFLKMLDTCAGPGGVRDRAALTLLLDTGARAAEVCAMSLEDYNEHTGEITIQKGKGGKKRVVFLGTKARRVMRAYLKTRPDARPFDALIATLDGFRLTFSGLREIIRRRARQAAIKEPGLHDFRRAFALACLRNGMDIISLSRLMGHSTVEVLKRYLDQGQDDLRKAHYAAGVVDRLRA